MTYPIWVAVRDSHVLNEAFPIEPTFYMAFAQSLEPSVLQSVPSMSMSIRSAGEIAPARLATSVAAAIANVDGAATVSFQTLTETLSVYYIRERLLAMLSGYFAAFALLLGGVGVYGVTAHAASRRRTEIGVRMALGATSPAILRLMMGRAGMLCGLGLVAGGLLILWAGGLVRFLLFNVEPWDPGSIIASVAGLAGVAMLAAWIPARRAAGVEPAIVLRES